MGDPKFQRKKYSTPAHPWRMERITAENELTEKYGFKNKQEIWKLDSKLKNFSRQAKKLIAEKTAQSEKEKLLLLKKLKGLGLLSESASMEGILSITLKDILERRLQSIVFRKGLARTMAQARQFIVHGHIEVNGKKLTSPNFLVPVSIENAIGFIKTSNLSDDMHPERAPKDIPNIKPKEEKKSHAKNNKKEEAKK